MRMILVVMIFLSGCVSPQRDREERARNAVNRLGTHCEAIGYIRDTEPWRQCVLKLYQAAATERAGQSKGVGSCQTFRNGDIICN